MQQREVAVVESAPVLGAGIAGGQRATGRTFLTGKPEDLSRVISHQIEGRGVAAHVHEDLHALADHEEHARDWDGRIQQTLVIPDDIEGAIVAKAEIVATLDLRIKNAQPHELLWQAHLRAKGTIDQDIVAVIVERRGRATVLRVLVETELVCRIQETAARECQGDVIHTISPGQPECGFRRIADDEESARAQRELLLRGDVQMGMIPKGRRVVEHGKGGRPSGAAGDDLARPAIHDRGNMEAVPVNCRRRGAQQRRVRLIEVVLHIELHVIALVHDQCRAPHQCSIIADGRRGGPKHRRSFRSQRGELLARLTKVQIQGCAHEDVGNDQRIVSLRGRKRGSDRAAGLHVTRAVEGGGGDGISAEAERDSSSPGREVIVARCRHVVDLDRANAGERIRAGAGDGDGIGVSRCPGPWRANRDHWDHGILSG